MAGLINDATQPEQQPMGDEMMAEQPPAEEASTEGAPADAVDDAVQQVVTGAMELLYRHKTLNQIVQSIAQAGDVAQGLADATYQLMTILDDKSGGQIPEEALIPSAIEILGLIAEDYEKVSGQPVAGRDIAVASQKMLIRFFQENGVDTAEVQQNIDYDKLGALVEQYRAQHGQQAAEGQ